MTRRPSNIIAVMFDLPVLFGGRCADKTTLAKLIELTNDRTKRSKAHALFTEIRQKTLLAEKRGDEFALAHYAFEEICAKTLFNLTGPQAPFDPDSAFWVCRLPSNLDSGWVSDPVMCVHC
jgi:hypothetical protein